MKREIAHPAIMKFDERFPMELVGLCLCLCICVFVFVYLYLCICGQMKREIAHPAIMKFDERFPMELVGGRASAEFFGTRDKGTLMTNF